ncbi:antibiotic biosynthesis monooxygenase family protein [Candidatus Protofrankia californiensis]|uniref:antibiotic biosynthesis monooxygenase family protein n=1 Tax=Candidatus Protofrankia californiensis TaxID=1839754 RepID=UPI0010412FCF|nr:antibiotic biosynthesis monooxygenase family protein [Candidatus Protofrankia californiensis]
MTVPEDGTQGSPVLEVARFDVVPGEEEKFADAYRSVVTELATCPGFRSARMTRGVEAPSRFILLVEWENLDAHLVNFRGSDRFTRWRAALGLFFAQPPSVEHVTDLP